MSRQSRLRAVAKRKGKKRRRPARQVPERERIAGDIPVVNMDQHEFKREASGPVIERDPSIPSGGVDLLEEL